MRRWAREIRYRLRRRLRALLRPRLPRRSAAKLTRQAANELWPENRRCQHCGCWHDTACPRVKRMVFRGDGVASVEFWEWSPRDWDRWTRERNQAVTLTTRAQREAMIGED